VSLTICQEGGSICPKGGYLDENHEKANHLYFLLEMWQIYGCSGERLPKWAHL
jgi:hypothetical protein